MDQVISVLYDFRGIWSMVCNAYSACLWPAAVLPLGRINSMDGLYRVTSSRCSSCKSTRYARLLKRL